MGAFEVTAQIMLIALKMLDRHQRNALRNKILSIKRRRYVELGKDVLNRDQAMLDFFDHELLIVGQEIISGAKDAGSDTTPQS